LPGLQARLAQPGHGLQELPLLVSHDGVGDLGQDRAVAAVKAISS